MRVPATLRRLVDFRGAGLALAILVALAIGPSSAAAAVPGCFAPESISPEVGDTSFFGGCQDPDGDPVSVVITQQGTKGTASSASISPGQVSVQYKGTQVGSDTVKFKATAGGEDSQEYTVTINNTPEVNDPPQCFAFANNPDVEVGDTTTAGFCQDEEGDPVTPTATDPPEKGEVTFPSGGSVGTQAIRYKATAEGDDSFKVKAGGGNDTEVSFTTHNVPEVNDAPVCTVNPGLGEIEVGETAFPAACSDDEGSPLTVTISDGPTKGQTSTQAFGGSTVVGYRADAPGSDSFKVKANDGTQDSAQITVTTSNVPAVNDPPSCGFGPGTIEAEIGEEALAGSCFDEEGDPITITITQQGTKGTATVTDSDVGPPSVVYTASATGGDTFKYKATDGNGDSNEVTVTTNNVPATNDPPVCGPGFPLELEVGESTPDTGCFDEEGDPITLSVTQAPTKGTVTFKNNGTSNATGQYTATAVGQDTFKIKANDGTSDSNEVTFTSTNTAAANDLPQCGAGGPVGGTEIGQAVTIGGCIDEEDDNLDVTITQQGTKGTAVVIDDNTPNPTIQYTGSAIGSDTIKFKANDGTGDSNEASVTTNNTEPPSNVEPVCTGATDRAVQVGQSTDFTCTDTDGDALDVSITQAATRGTVTILGDNTATPTIRYTATQAGAGGFKFKANDGEDDSNEATVTTVNTVAPTTGGGTGGAGGTPGAGGGGSGGGGGGNNTPSDTNGQSLDPPNISGAGSAGTAAVSSKGAFNLPQSVDCTGPGPDCAASTSASGSVPANLASSSAKRKNIKLGSSSFKVKSGRKGKVTVKLTKKGLRALKRAKRLKVTVTIKVKRGAKTVTKKVKVTLKAPKRR